MKDKDTHILEERYNKIVKERDGYDLSPDETHDSSQATIQTIKVLISMKMGEEVIEDIPVEVDFEIYKGSTPPGGPDPAKGIVTMAIVSDDIHDEAGNVVINAGTTLQELQQQGIKFIPDQIQNAVDDHISHNM